MNKQKLRERLDGLIKGRDQILQELHATSGAIQEVQYWLKEIEKEEKENVSK